MKKAVIIFLKQPKLGSAKTRLAATVGDQNALKVYIELLNHTYNITNNLNLDKFLYYHKIDDIPLAWEGNYQIAYQVQSDLGNKMQTAFEEIFDKGYDQIILMGSDCFELSTEIIEEGFRILNDKDVVIGPAKDGGYYLIGMKKMYSQIFNNIAWSTDQVYASTVQISNQSNLSFDTLPVLSDIDVEEDLTPYLQSLIKD